MITVTAVIQPYEHHEQVPLVLVTVTGEHQKDIYIKLFRLLNWSGLDEEQETELREMTLEDLKEQFDSVRYGDGSDGIIAVIQGDVKFWNGYEFIENVC